ncbi:MAG: right-handed parallel beta-helix repeat-containing protein, partial [Planctomycetota bacterium]
MSRSCLLDHPSPPVVESLEPRLLLAVINLTPGDNWFDVLNGQGLSPGDEVILAEGVYSNSRRMVMSHMGTEADPILIRAADGAAVTITRPDANQNVVNIHGAEYLTLRGLAITGGSSGMRIGDGGIGRNSAYVTIEYCHIHDTGGNAITANYVGDVNVGHIFRYNEIDHTSGHGEGFYLGSNNDANGNTTSVFRDGLIEGNYIHDLNGPSISQGDGIEIKDGSYNNIIRDNVIHDTNYPGILVYGTDGNASNIIEGNVIWNGGDHGIQAASEAIIRNNIILSQSGDGIASMDHQSAIPGSLTIVHNTIFSQGSSHAIDISPPSSGQLSGPIIIANNALYPQGNGRPMDLPNLSGHTVSGNVGVGSPYPSQPVSAFDPSGNESLDFGDVANKDVFPIPGSALIAAGDPTYVEAIDFNYTSRAGIADVGAYAYNPGGNPGWQIVPGFKQIPSGGPVVTLSATDASAAEAGPDAGAFAVTRDETAGDLTVNYTISGTASAADYSETLSGSVVIPDGQPSQTITITPVDDSDVEGDETVTLTLTADAAYTVGSPSSDTVTIADNDLAVVSITANDAAAAEAGPDAGQFTVTRDDSTGDLTVNYDVSGTAGA